jgi:hypothetical protein
MAASLSERRACRVIDADRQSVRYRSIRDENAGLRERLRDLANQRRPFGYRRLHILLRREGVMINRKKTQRGSVRANAPCWRNGSDRLGQGDAQTVNRH